MPANQKQTLIETCEDCEWLRSTHLPKDAPKFVRALVWGNEDYPERVELYGRNHIDARIAIYVVDAAGNLTPDRPSQTPRRPVHPINAPEYAERIRLGRFGYTIRQKPQALRDSELARILRERFASWTREDHRRASVGLAVYAARLDRAWSRAADIAHTRTFGKDARRSPLDYLVSGIGRSEYPENYKDRLRTFAHTASTAEALAAGHLYAATKLRRMPR